MSMLFIWGYFKQLTHCAFHLHQPYRYEEFDLDLKRVTFEVLTCADCDKVFYVNGEEDEGSNMDRNWKKK